VVEGGDVDTVPKKSSRDPAVLSTVYENVARESVITCRVRKTPFPFESCGRYWEKDAEIDLVALSRKNDWLYLVKSVTIDR